MKDMYVSFETGGATIAIAFVVLIGVCYLASKVEFKKK
jgi:hypothetical protein